MVEESKYSIEVIKKHFNKELVMPKEDNESFKNSTRSWIYDNAYVRNDVKVRGHCHITGKYRVSALRDRNINLKLNDKIPVVIYNLKKIHARVIIQELRKFRLKTNVILNGLGKYMSFTINKFYQ